MTEKLRELLKDELITFSALNRLINDDNEYIESYYENYIICYQKKSYPVWLWTKKDISD